MLFPFGPWDAFKPRGFAVPQADPFPGARCPPFSVKCAVTPKSAEGPALNTQIVTPENRRVWLLTSWTWGERVLKLTVPMETDKPYSKAMVP